MISFDAKALKKMSAAIAKVAENAGDLRPAWPHVDRFTSRVFRMQFATEGAYLLRRKWRAWSPKWAKRRLRPGGGRGGIGRDTNRMWGSFVKPRAPEGVSRWDPLEYERGSVVPYALHFDRLRPIMPAKLPENVVGTYLALIERHMLDGVGA